MRTGGAGCALHACKGGCSQHGAVWLEGGASPGGRQHLTGSSGGCYIAVDVVGAVREPRDELQLRFQRFRRFLCHQIEYVSLYLLRRPLSSPSTRVTGQLCVEELADGGQDVMCELTAWSMDPHILGNMGCRLDEHEY